MRRHDGGSPDSWTWITADVDVEDRYSGSWYGELLKRGISEQGHDHDGAEIPKIKYVTGMWDYQGAKKSKGSSRRVAQPLSLLHTFLIRHVSFPLTA